MKLRLGIGSWADPEYRELLRPPPDVKASERLKAYAAHFAHVEVNSTYYALPRATATARWVKQTPEGFTFNVKLHRAFSQNPRKAATEGAWAEKLLVCTRPLIETNRFGAFFLVMPPSFGPENHALDELAPLAKKLRPQPLAVELRDRAWIEGDARVRTLEFFREHELVWIAVDMPRLKSSSLMPAIDEVTHPRIAYLRLHGRNRKYLQSESEAERHAYVYRPAELRGISDRVLALGKRAKEVHVIANNHAHDYAPRTALALQALLGGSREKKRTAARTVPGMPKR